MRDIRFIDNFLLVLKVLWEKHSDLRFGQLIHIISEGNNSFNWEESKWLEKIIELINKRKE